MIVTDVRVMRQDHGCAHHAPRRVLGEPLHVDHTPPAAGPEVEITMAGELDAVREALEAAGVTVLAIRQQDVHPRHGVPGTFGPEEIHRHSPGFLRRMAAEIGRRRR